jgi:hypothetical protein
MARVFNPSLHPGQAAIHNSPARFKVVAAGRRFGKSHYAAIELIIEALLSENKFGYPLGREAGVYYVAPTFDQAKRIMWPKLQELAGYAKHGGLITRENSNEGWLELVSGRRIYIKGADNPDSLRGIALSFVVMDEFADMKSFVWEEIVEPALMDYEGCALFIGTPKGKNHFYKLHEQALLYEYPNDVDPYPMYEAFHFTSGDNPMIKRHELARMTDTSKRSVDAIKQEIEASFVSGGGRVLKPSNFPVVERPTSSSGSLYITCDLAGFAKSRGKVLKTDETVIGITLVNEDRWSVIDMLHGHWDPREVALRLVKTYANYPGSQLGVEKGALFNAIGPYLDDYMREFNRYVTPYPLTHGNQAKTDRIEWALQGRSERGKIELVKGDWNQWFLDQVADFPDPLSHDDGIDTIAYVDQMATVNYTDLEAVDEWEALDLYAGY